MPRHNYWQSDRNQFLSAKALSPFQNASVTLMMTAVSLGLYNMMNTPTNCNITGFEKMIPEVDEVSVALGHSNLIFFRPREGRFSAFG